MTSSVERFEEHRPLLLRTAYRVLGSVAEAEEIVQEAYLRWREVEVEEVHSAPTFLVATVTRLALDRLRALDAERERYPGPWLPEPVVTGEQSRANAGGSDPSATAERLDTAFMMMLERLTPAQRAAYVLRDVFDFEYQEIARALDSTEASCRQHLSRARRRLEEHEVRYDASVEEAREVRRAFAAAALDGDLEGLISLLAEDAVHITDGGGEVPAAREPVRGAENIARLLVGVVEGAAGEVRLQPREVNGTPGLVAQVDGRLASVVTFAIDDGRIKRVYQVLSPPKLEAALDDEHVPEVV